MGRGRVTMQMQIGQRFAKMADFGRSKHADKAENGNKPRQDKLYSRVTLQNYKASCSHFASWAEERYGKSLTLRLARQYVPEYLAQRAGEGKSAWTIRADAAALAKVYGCKTTDLGFKLPKRERHNITQHRNKSAVEFSEVRNAGLVDLCRGTGLRRHEVALLRPDDVTSHSDGRVTVHVRQGKGGKERTVEALPSYARRVAQMAAQAAAEGRSKVIERIPVRSPIHEYRRGFAQALYRERVRESIPPEGRYTLRAGPMAGRSLDRMAMHEVSVALGHKRLDVVVGYLEG